MTYRVIQAPGCAILRPDHDAVFATEAEAKALLEYWATQYPGVRWEVECCAPQGHGTNRLAPPPVNAEWVNGRVRRLDRTPNFRNRTPTGPARRS
jgi:hypothetical protein